MFKNSIQSFFILISSCYLISCTNSSSDLPISGSISNADDVKQAYTSLTQYNDSVDLAWEEVIKADSLKMADIDRLILEISYAHGAISGQDFLGLQQLQKKVQANHLQAKDQFNNGSLHKYDAMEDSLVNLTFYLNGKLKLAHKVKPIMNELVESIERNEDRMIIKRAQYDEAAKHYNTFFSQKKSLIILSDSSYSSKPLRAYFNNVNPI